MRKCKFPATVADLTEALENLMRPTREAEQRRNRTKLEEEERQKQIAHTVEYERKRTPEELAKAKKYTEIAVETINADEPKEIKVTPRYLNVTDEDREKAFKNLETMRG